MRTTFPWPAGRQGLLESVRIVVTSVGAYVSAKQVKSILVNAGVQWFLSRIRCTR